MPYEYIGIEKEDGVAIITLNRPEKHNALSQGFWLNSEARLTKLILTKPFVLWC